MSLGLMIQEDSIGRTLGNRVRSSSPRGPMFRKAMLWFPALALVVLSMACRKPDAAVSKAGDQITGPQVTQTATGQEGNGAPVEKPADQPAQVPTVAEVNASEATVARPTDQVAKDPKDQGAPLAAGERGVAPTSAQAANPTKGSGTSPTTAKAPAGQAAPVRVLTTAEPITGKVFVARPAGQVTRSGKDQSASLAARVRVVTPTPRTPTATTAKGPEAGQVPAKTPTDQPALALTPSTQGVSAAQGPEAARATAGTTAGQAAPALVPTPAEVDASKAAVVSSPDEGAKGGKDLGASAAAEGKVEAASPTPAADAAKGTEAVQATAGTPAEQITPAQVPTAEDVNAGKVAVETPAEQAARLAKGQGVPVTAAGGKVVPLLPPPTQAANAANAARGPASRATSPADQAALALVATTDKDWSVRWAAVEGLTSQAVLARIATNDDDVDIRKLAVSMLTDQAALARIARRDKDWSVRWAAVNRLTARAVLAQIAENDPDADIRKLAVTKLENRAVAP